MAGCELNVAHAFVSAPPTAHRLRHDVIVTSADDFDASRRRRCDDDDDDADRVGVIPHYRLVPNAFGPAVRGEWVTLSKAVLLQLVERICQLSFQTDALSAAASCPQPSDCRDAAAETSMDAAESTYASAVAAEQPGCLSPPAPSTSLTEAATGDAAASATTSQRVLETSNAADELTAVDQGPIDDVAASRTTSVTSDDAGVISSRPLSVDETSEKANRDDDDVDDDDSGYDLDVFADPLEMEEASARGDKSENSPLIAENSPSMSTESDVVDAASASLTVAPRYPPSPTTTPLRSTQSSRVDRRRRLRELRRHRRHRHSDELGRDRVRRRFAVPRQPPLRRQVADAEHRDASPARLPVRRRVSQPWSALNKVLVCQLVDVVLKQELTSTGTARRFSGDRRRASGTIWNPAMTPERRTPPPPPPPPHLSPTVADFSSLGSVDTGASTLLHTLLFPMAAAAAEATAYVDRRRSTVDADAGSASLSWSLPQPSPSLRRRHHSAATPDAFHWTPPAPPPAPPPPSFFWYNVPPSQGSFFLLPDVAAAGRLPCWIGAAQPLTTLPPPTSADGCALDYSTRPSGPGPLPDAIDVEPRDAAAVSERPSVPRRRGSTPPDGASRLSARLKWVVVDKTDVCSLFESLASSMVADGNEKRATEEPREPPPAAGTDRGSTAAGAAAATAEPIKWKSTLLRRARAEAQTPQRPDSEADVAQNVHVSH